MAAYNTYNNREKTNQTASEVVSYINLAKSMALTNQVTANFTNSLDCVAVQIKNGYITAYPENIALGVGSSYFSKKITDNGATISTINLGMLRFGSNNGKLLDSFGAPVSASAVGTTIMITSNLSGDDKRVVSVSPAGIIKLTSVNN